MSIIPVNSTPVLASDELDTLRRTIGHDLDDNEFELFAAICRRTGLDPFARQIYAVMRWDGRQKRNVMQIQTGIDGLRLIAERSGTYAGQTPAEWCGQDGKWVDVWLSDQAPAAARVGVLRHDFKEPVYGVAKFASYCATNKDGTPQAMWKTMPEVMIAKCAEALAIRKAFPNDVSGVYTKEEMGQQHNVTGPPLATPAHMARIDELLPQVPQESMPALKAWKAEAGISMKAGEFTAEMADDVIAKLEELAVTDAEIVTGGSSGEAPSGDTSAPDPEAPVAPPTVEPDAVVTAGVEVGTAPAGGPSTPGGEIVTGGEGTTGQEAKGVAPRSADAESHASARADAPTPSGDCDAPTPLKVINERGYQQINKRCRAIQAEHFPADDQSCRSKDRAVLEAAQPQWTALNYACSGGRAKHLSGLTPDEASVFRTRCIDLAEGRAVWAESDDPQWLGWTLIYGDEAAA